MVQAAGLNNNKRPRIISSFQNPIPATSARRGLSLLDSLGKVCQEPTFTVGQLQLLVRLKNLSSFIHDAHQHRWAMAPAIRRSADLGASWSEWRSSGVKYREASWSVSSGNADCTPARSSYLISARAIRVMQGKQASPTHSRLHL